MFCCLSVLQVIDMIRAGEKGQPHRGWLYDIVANGRNGLDCDKFDYLQVG
jgi:hypothetical protein